MNLSPKNILKQIMNQSKAIKVCHITSAHASTDIRIFHKECVTLAKAGFQVSLVAANTKEEFIDGVQILSANVNQSGRISRMLKTTKAVYKKALSLDADVYHFHDPELLRFALRLKRKGKTVIYDAHEDVPRQILGKHWIPNLFRKMISSSFELYENSIAKKLSFIVVSTPTIEQRFTKINHRCAAICNYPILKENVDIPSWESRKNEICYVGGITVIRGVREIVESISNLPDVKLHLAGLYSPESLKIELMQLEGWSKVTDYGYVGRTEIIEILNQSKVGMVTLYPQLNYLDSLPIKMFEYMLAGLPVIASNFPLWKEIIDSSNCGLTINPKNPSEIANAIQYLLENDEIAEQMGKNGRKAILEKYNWEAEGVKLIEIYNKLSLPMEF